MKLSKIIKTTIFAIPLLVLLIFPTKVEAKIITDSVHNYTFLEDLTTNVLITTTIRNIEKNKYISNYSFNIPEKTFSVLVTEVDGMKINPTEISERKYNINIPTSTQKDNVVVIRINYKTDKLVENYGNLHNIYLPSTNSEDVKTSQINIIYPFSWGEINYSSVSEYELLKLDNNYDIKLTEISNKNGAYFSMGEEQYFDFNIQTILDKNVENIVLNIPQTDYSQELYFPNFEINTATILTDKYFNQFVKYENVDRIGLNMQIKNNIVKDIQVDSSKWDDAYYLSQSEEIKDKSKELSTPLDVYNYLKNNFQFQDSLITTDIDISEIASKKGLNSLELSVLTSNLLHNIGIKSIVVAGIYTGGDNLIDAKNKLWFWNQYIDENGHVKNLDVSFALATGFDGYKSIGLNHIKMFYWIDNQVNVSFPSNFTIPEQFKFSAIADLVINPSKMESINILPNNENKVINSGVDEGINILIENNTPKVLSLSKILINSKNVEINNPTIEGYTKLIAPNEKFLLNYKLTNNDWSYNGSSDNSIKVYATVMGSEYLISQKNFILNYRPMNLVVILSWVLRVLIALVLTIIIYITYKYAIVKLTKKSNSEKI